MGTVIQFLSDPTVLAVLGALGASASIISYIISGTVKIWNVHKQPNRREIAYEIISDTPMLSIPKEIEGKVTIEFDNKPVQPKRNLHLVTLRILNSGNESFEEKDFVNPIVFEFGDNANILDAKFKAEKPSDLILKNIDHSIINTIKIWPRLLNKKNIFKVEVLVADFNGHVEGQVQPH